MLKLKEVSLKEAAAATGMSVAAPSAAGYRAALRRLEAQPWLAPVPPDVGVVIHGLPEKDAQERLQR